MHANAINGETDPAEFFDLDHHVFYWMTQVMGRRDRQLGAELRRHRLRVPEWRVLALLKVRQPLSLGEAAMTVGLDHTTMSRTVDRMVRAGRILRLSDTADMRVTRLGLTAAGTRLFEQVWPIVLRLNREALARLPAGSIPLLCLALREMGRAMDESWQSGAHGARSARQSRKGLAEGRPPRQAAGGSSKESRS